MTWKARYRVYWEDTDAGGVVYHARYLHFFERARSDWLRALGFPQVELRAERDRLFAVSRMTTDFIAPARLEDELEVSVVVQAVGAASAHFAQEIHRGDGELLATADVRAACLDAARFRPARIPADVMNALKTTISEDAT